MMHAVYCAIYIQQSNPVRPPIPHHIGEDDEVENEEENEEVEKEEEHEVVEGEKEDMENEEESEEEEEEEVENEENEEVENEENEAVENEENEEVNEEENEEEELTTTSVPAVISTRTRHCERGAYSVDDRGRIVTAVSASQSTCSLQHLPVKTPSLTVRYATGGDKAAFASLAAQLLQFPAAQVDNTTPITELPGMVSRLVDASTTFLPPHPCPAPASLEAASLATWDCSGQVLHLQRLLQLATRVTVMAQYHVGGFLRQVVASANTTNSKERSDVLAALANTASKDSNRHYNAILSSCACDQCSHALPGQAGGGVRMPCRTSQVMARFARDSLANITPTFFRQCMQMHAALPPTHALFTECVETVTVTPTHARLLAVGLHQAVCSLRRLGTPLPRANSQLGLWRHFQVATHPEEAIDFVDGDGGYLVVDHIPGLRDFVHARAPAIIWHEGMRGELVPFRCHGHDALELEHLYHCPNGTHHHLGYEALCAARGAVAKAAAISVHSAGEVDIHGRRLVCTIAITTSRQGRSTSLGECFLQAGLSYPMPGAPATFTRAFTEAQASSSGVFAVLPHSLATSHQLHPSQLRAALGPSSRSVHLVHNGEVYKVTGRSELRDASHVIVWESQEKDAGQGAFVRSRPPHLPDHVRPFIKEGSIICGYGKGSLSEEQFQQLSPQELEYTLTVNFRGTFHYNAHIYNGHNIGCYVNQGGLQQALDRLLHMARVGGRFEFSRIEEEAQLHCNCKFAKRRNFGAALIADRQIRLRDNPTELLANYGIEGYWLGFFARHCAELGFEHPMVRIVLWCATSHQSHLPQEIRDTITQEIPPGVQIPPDLTPR